MTRARRQTHALPAAHARLDRRPVRRDARTKGKSEGITPGDRILKIDGKPIDQAAAEARSLISGATEQWIRWRLASRALDLQFHAPG